jgi:hypothetical protein
MLADSRTWRLRPASPARHPETTIASPTAPPSKTASIFILTVIASRSGTEIVTALTPLGHREKAEQCDAEGDQRIYCIRQRQTGLFRHIVVDGKAESGRSSSSASRPR